MSSNIYKIGDYVTRLGQIYEIIGYNQTRDVRPIYMVGSSKVDHFEWHKPRTTYKLRNARTGVVDYDIHELEFAPYLPAFW